MKIKKFFSVKYKNYEDLEPGDVFSLDILSGRIYMKIHSADMSESVSLLTGMISHFKPELKTIPIDGEFVIKSGGGVKYEFED